MIPLGVSRRSHWRLVPYLAALLALLFCSGCFAEPVSAAGLALDGAWRSAAAGEQAHEVGRDDAGLVPLDPAIYTQVKGAGETSWVLLWPREGLWPQTPFVLDVLNSGLQTLTVYPPDGSAPQQSTLMSRQSRLWPSHVRLAFPILDAPVQGQPLRVYVDSRGVMPAAMMFTVQDVNDHLRSDARWLALASASLAVMLAMALIALFFSVRLRDMTFFHYAIYILAYVLILALQTGYVFEPLGWDAVFGSVQTWGRVAVSTAVVFSVLFLDSFSDLRRYAPHGRRVLLGYAIVVTLVSLVSLALSAGGLHLARAAINPLLILGGPLVLGVSLLAAWRGSRYARFFLLGWTPLLSVTVVGSLQHFGIATSWTWVPAAMLSAGVFESLVLSLALADRSLALRRDRDQARRLADIDPLTGLFNRRAWSERLLRIEESMRLQRRPLSILFLDLDHFKALNDRFGHAAGDVALRELAVLMREELGNAAPIGRYGGEEFVVALAGADNAQATAAAQRIRQRLRDRSLKDPEAANPTVSIGVATRELDEELSVLLRRADEAMYRAKAAGRDRVVSAQ